MISSGMTTILMKGLFGDRLEHFFVNYLGKRRGSYAMIFAYIVTFYGSMSFFNSRKRLNINHMVNPRDFNGEVLMNIVLKYYPHKVN